jgi:integrin-linked kinase
METLRLQLPVGMSAQMQKLIRICMNEDPVKRPKFDMILPILEKMIKNRSLDSQ